MKKIKNIQMRENRLAYKQGYDYIANFAADYTNMAKHFKGVADIGHNLIKACKNRFVSDELFELNYNLSYLSSLLQTKIQIFANRWDECFRKTYYLYKKDNHNPFFFINNIFKIEKHLDREINDFYHGWYSPLDYVSNADKTKLEQYIKNLSTNNIYDFMRFLDNKRIIFNESYFKHCKKEKLGEGLGPLKDFGNITFKEYNSISNVLLPFYKSYINLLINNITHSVEKFGNPDVSRISSFTKKILESAKFSKKIWKFFIIKEWNEYIDRLQGLMSLFIFIYLSLKSNNFNEKDLFIKSNFAKDTNWYNQYNENKNEHLQRYEKKYKLLLLKKVKN